VKISIPRSLKNGKLGDTDDCGTMWFEYHVKSPLRALLIGLMRQYPRATSVKTKNGKAWLEIKRKYLKYERIKRIKALASPAFDTIIGELEHDAPYGTRINFIVLELFIAVIEGRYDLGEPFGNIGEYSWELEEVMIAERLPELSMLDEAAAEEIAQAVFQ